MQGKMFLELQSKKSLILTVLCIGLPIYTWYSLIKTWADLKRQWKAKTKFKERHNCVVMYNREAGITGWPYLNKDRNPLDYKVYYEPVLYFINTATESLDIAIMTLHSEDIRSALLEAHKRGVAVRLLLDLCYSKDYNKSLQDAGVQILYFESPLESIPSILHYKYALKDYSKGNGYLLNGSMNWSFPSFYENYENLIFTTNPQLVEEFHNNFEESWKIVKNICMPKNYVSSHVT